LTSSNIHNSDQSWVLFKRDLGNHQHTFDRIWATTRHQGTWIDYLPTCCLVASCCLLIKT